jgi:hypothetical protein
LEEGKTVESRGRRRRVVIVLAACALVGIGVVTFWPGEREPEYNGKKLSEWLAVAGKSFWNIDHTPVREPFHFDENASPAIKEAVGAVRAIGTYAVPLLLKWAADDHQKWEEWVLKTGQRLPRFLHAYPLALSIVRNTGRNQRAAVIGFAILGQKAAPVVPELATLVEKSKSRDSRIAAMYCLGVLAETARPALPCLKRHAKTSQAYERFWIEQVIWNIEGDDPVKEF